MELAEALERIDAIHAQVARTAIFRGYKAATVGCTGLLALMVSAVQPLLVPQPQGNVYRYLQLWIGVAAVSAVGVGVELALRCWRSQSAFQRKQTLEAAEQFLPCLVAGASVTWAVVQFSPDAAHLLPGLWAVAFSLGIFSSCRQLPAAAVAVAVYYLAAVTTCLALAQGEFAFSPWAMAGTFGVGQLLTAAVLYCSLERCNGGV